MTEPGIARYVPARDAINFDLDRSSGFESSAHVENKNQKATSGALQRPTVKRHSVDSLRFRCQSMPCGPITYLQRGFLLDMGLQGPISGATIARPFCSARHKPRVIFQVVA